MQKIKLQIKNEQGLHARPSTKFVEAIDYFDGNIYVVANGEKINAKNVMGLMLLSLGQYDEFEAIAVSNSGDEAEEIKVLSKIKHLVEVLKFNE